jgi:hypothetical protein
MLGRSNAHHFLYQPINWSAFDWLCLKEMRVTQNDESSNLSDFLVVISHGIIGALIQGLVKGFLGDGKEVASKL